MLFSCKFSDLVKRDGVERPYYLAYSSNFDKTGILFFPPKDVNLSNFIESLVDSKNSKRLGDYEFKVSYRCFKGKDGTYKSYFNLVGINSINSAD